MGKKKEISKNAEKRHEKEELAKRVSRELFSKFYVQQYGLARWESLLFALTKPVRYCALMMRWTDAGFAHSLLGVGVGSYPLIPEVFPNVFVKLISTDIIPSSAGGEDFGEVDVLKHEHDCEILGSSDTASKESSSVSTSVDMWPHPGAPSSLDSNGLCCYYPLDAASLFPVKILSVQLNDRVFDICAAPGGKSLAILQYLFGGLGSLVCGDISTDRRMRLRNVMKRYVPASLLSRVSIVAGDGATSQFIDEFGERSFDKILVDAPCSSERHVLHSEEELMKWAPGRTKANAERQMSLLLTALRLCRAGGRVVYSTCSLSNVENDAVVLKAIRRANKYDRAKRTDDVGFISAVRPVEIGEVPFGEKTECGWAFLPDVSDGWGPIYMSVIDVRSEITATNDDRVLTVAIGGKECLDDANEDREYIVADEN